MADNRPGMKRSALRHHVLLEADDHLDHALPGAFERGAGAREVLCAGCGSNSSFLAAGGGRPAAADRRRQRRRRAQDGDLPLQRGDLVLQARDLVCPARRGPPAPPGRPSRRLRGAVCDLAGLIVEPHKPSSTRLKLKRLRGRRRRDGLGRRGPASAAARALAGRSILSRAARGAAGAFAAPAGGTRQHLLRRERRGDPARTAGQPSTSKSAWRSSFRAGCAQRKPNIGAARSEAHGSPQLPGSCRSALLARARNVGKFCIYASIHTLMPQGRFLDSA